MMSSQPTNICLHTRGLIIRQCHAWGSFENASYVSPVKLGVVLTVLAGSEAAAIHTEDAHDHQATAPSEHTSPGFDLLDCHSSM